MKQHWKRLLIAALTSSSVFGLTWAWYVFSAQGNSQINNTTPLAYVEKIEDDLQKRAATRLLWQSTEKGDPLYDGEAIRTSSSGEARIVFADSESYLDLEADSIIVLKKSKGEISLDLLEGNLFVKAQAEAGSNIVLNSQEGKVDLSKTSAAISREKGKAVALEVLAGQAIIKNGAGSTQTVSVKNDLKVLSPNLERALIISADKPEPLKFEWQSIAKTENYKFFAGPAREKMKLLQTVKMPSASVSLASGKHYWKIEAYDNSGKKISQTPTFRSEILERYTPMVSSPPVNAEIVSKSETNGSISFKWQNPAEISTVKLELYHDSEPRRLISSKSFSALESSYTFANLPFGNYQWKMLAQFKDSDLQISGRIQKIKLISPADIKPLVITLAKESRTQIFNYAGPAQISWSTDRPDRVHKWKLRLHPQGESKKALPTIELSKSESPALLPHSGVYNALIEAFDINEQKIGSLSDTINLIEPPLPGAPSFLPTTGALSAEADGQTTLNWENNPKAQAYVVIVKRDNRVMSEKEYSKPSARFKNLLPGEYQVQVLTIDKYKRRGPASLPRSLVVPDTSNLKAPSLKKVKVN